MKAGFRPLTASSTPNHAGASTNDSSSTLKGKGKASKNLKSGFNGSLELLRGIYFVPHAYSYLTHRLNNAGNKVAEIRCPSLTLDQKSRLEGRGYARVSTPSDPLLVDPKLDPQETASYLASLFPDIYQQYLSSVGASNPESVPIDWFIQLIKTQRSFSNVPAWNAVG
ncbi:hypothetical protein CTheo_9163 [Ceratobasidium theobromae]|uniref:Uncharacterized protein n=1 Tax=Ceratobasidium theobromae TaxID=1582974 RepID=A0A5N5Q6F3_9AGAM|nr:hypothetical protein CTheo_9163 [Ceratobasidium theobromae]